MSFEVIPPLTTEELRAMAIWAILAALFVIGILWLSQLYADVKLQEASRPIHFAQAK
jgi:hypothetical protein